MNNEELDDELEKIDGSVWKKIFSLVFKKKKNIILMIISVIILAGLDVLFPYLNSKTIDVFFSENPDFSKTPMFISFYILIALSYFVCIYSFIKQAGCVEVSVGYEIRKEAFEKLQKLPFSYYDKTPTGWIMARLTSDSRKLAEIISWGMVDLVWGLASMIGILIMLIVTNWRLALIIVLITPVLLLVCLFFERVILKAYRKVRKINSKITGALNEGIMGAKTTKTLCLEETRNKEFDELSKKMKHESINAVIKSSLFWPIIFVLGYVAVGLTLRIGAGFALGEFAGIAIKASVLYLFIDYTIFYFQPVMNIARIISEFQQAQASAERIIGLINIKEDITDSSEVIEKYGTVLNPILSAYENVKGDVLFDHVSFSYSEKEVVLDDFTLDVKAGTSVALVGRTGAGKSTIINLLCRFYEPTKGTIYIDGVDYKKRSLGWLHSKLGYVLQTPYLFNGTIKENIAFGKPNATEEEIIKAATDASAMEFISKLPDGFNTMVGEGGNKLSLGERQLISFARAIIIDPQILILDEATSSIDTETEGKIQLVTNEIMKGRTTFIVAHRLSTIVNADLILVIDDGKIIEKGTHKELLALKKRYYNLYKNQFISEKMGSSCK